MTREYLKQTETVACSTNERLTHIYQDGTPEFRQKWDNLYNESDRLWTLVRAAELAWERHNEQIRIFEEGLIAQQERTSGAA